MTKKYSVHSTFLTLQGEGANAGRAAVFIRFSGCNLWSGQERDRATATCQFCDTQFVGHSPTGGTMSADDILAKACDLWGPLHLRDRFVVMTGGEPLLQLDEALLRKLQDAGFAVAVETNGTVIPPRYINWTCVSPKAGSECVIREGGELKLVYPQDGIDPAQFQEWAFSRFWLSPKHDENLAANTSAAIAYCLAHPKWRLSVQMHKIVGIE